MPTYDAIVIGLGAMGSATAYHLARRGRRVLGLDAHPRGHAQGSSHGRSRIIREAYFEAPEYVPLVQRAYTLWRELEAESARKLLTLTGGLNVGPPDGGLVGGAIASAQQHGLPYERLGSGEVMARFPGFRVPDDLVAVFEPKAGILDPEACVGAHLDLAAVHGAELRHAEAVRSWRADGGGVRVETEQASYVAERLVIAPGPWAGELLRCAGEAGDDRPGNACVAPTGGGIDPAWFAVQRMVNVHFEPARPEPFAPERCPIYILEVPEGMYYGFPALPDQGVKFGRHDLGERCTPRTIRREVDPSEVEALREVLDRYLPGAAGPVKWTLTCMYTNTPDLDFILDRHPTHGQVVYGAGFSGHGFKFACVIGEVLADLALEGGTRQEIGFLSANRFC